MAVFSVYTVVHNEGESTFFAPGDTVPDWAESKVGDHVIDGAAAPRVEVEAETPKPAAVDEAGPDFTKPKQTRQRRK